jgi:hypothetical protein
MYAIGPDPLAAAGVDGVGGVASDFAVFLEFDPGVVAHAATSKISR